MSNKISCWCEIKITQTIKPFVQSQRDMVFPVIPTDSKLLAAGQGKALDKTISTLSSPSFYYRPRHGSHYTNSVSSNVYHR